MPINWVPANQPPVPNASYWARLAQMAQQSLRPPHPGLPVVTQRNVPPVPRG